MLKIVELKTEEQLELLAAMNFGHLACALDNQPYIVPMHYAFDGENILFLTLEGQKTEWLESNPRVCFQIERVADERHWQSVIVQGMAARLSAADEIGRAGDIIFKKHSSLAPAVSRTVIGTEEKSGRAAIYRLKPTVITGRKTAKTEDNSFLILEEA